jgi:ribosomal protein L11 methyltransferase
MYLWRRLAGPNWLRTNEAVLRSDSAGRLTIIEQPGRKRAHLEIACSSRRQANGLVTDFGGRMKELPRDWLNRFASEQKSKPLRIGRRLVILDGAGTRRSGRGGPSHIVIPPGAAFGTGQHSTTAMSLRLLEQITRSLKCGWSLVDLGTGSGIFALAAKAFGANHVFAIDVDPIAILTARANARLNKIEGVDFKVAEVRSWRPARKFDIVTANLFSELLIEILPKLKRSLKGDGRLILSGVLRSQERDLKRALRLTKIEILQVRRRGKWVALVCSGGLRPSHRFRVNRRLRGQYMRLAN